MGGAVAEYSHRLAGVLYGDAPDGALHPGPDLPQALAAGGDPRGVAVVELEEPLPLRPAHLAPGTVLPAAHVDLPQAGICVQLQSLGHIDGPGGGRVRYRSLDQTASTGTPENRASRALICFQPFSVTRASYQPWIRR